MKLRKEGWTEAGGAEKREGGE